MPETPQVERMSADTWQWCARFKEWLKDGFEHHHDDCGEGDHYNPQTWHVEVSRLQQALDLQALECADHKRDLEAAQTWAKAEQAERYKAEPQQGSTRDLLNTTDAVVWAREFIRILTEGKLDASDEGWMIAWFANAIETGRSAGQTSLTRDLEAAQRKIDRLREEYQDADTLMEVWKTREARARAELEAARQRHTAFCSGCPPSCQVESGARARLAASENCQQHQHFSGGCPCNCHDAATAGQGQG